MKTLKQKKLSEWKRYFLDNGSKEQAAPVKSRSQYGVNAECGLLNYAQVPGRL